MGLGIGPQLRVRSPQLKSWPRLLTLGLWTGPRASTSYSVNGVWRGKNPTSSEGLTDTGAPSTRQPGQVPVGILSSIPPSDK